MMVFWFDFFVFVIIVMRFFSDFYYLAIIVFEVQKNFNSQSIILLQLGLSLFLSVFCCNLVPLPFSFSLNIISVFFFVNLLALLIIFYAFNNFHTFYLNSYINFVLILNWISEILYWFFFAFLLVSFSFNWNNFINIYFNFLK